MTQTMTMCSAFEHFMDGMALYKFQLLLLLLSL